MIVNAGQAINLNMNITDKNGIAIFDDCPFVVIKALNTNKYYNGLFFVDEEVKVIMPHLGNGVYGIDMMLEEPCELSVLMESEKYSISKSESIIVIPEDCIHYCAPGKEFVYFVPMSRTLNMVCYAMTNERGEYYVQDSDRWDDLKTYNLLTVVNDNIAKMSFTTDVEGMYGVKIFENTDEKFMFTLKVSSEAPKGEIVMVNSNTLRSPDGSDSVAQTEYGAPIAGVKVTAINTLTKKIAASTTTNEVGEWHMMIERGKYLFSFEKQGYAMISFMGEV